MKNFTFTFNTKVFFGQNSRNYLNQILDNQKFKSLGVVIDHALLNIPLIKQFLNSLNVDIHLIECDISEPTYDKLEEKRIYSNIRRIDSFIGIGGGSALDMAKGLAVLYKNKLSSRTNDKYDR